MRSKLAAMLALLAVLATLLAAPLRAAGNAAKPAVKDAFLTLPDGAKIHYLEAGQGSPIVLITGWTIAADIWAKQIDHFAASHRVVAFDPRSQGKSSKSGEGSFPGARAYDLDSILSQLGLAPATLVCWSMAVTDCITYVDLYGSSKVSALVLVDGYAGEPFDDKRTVGTLRFVAQLQRNRRALTDSFVRSMFKKPQSEELLKHVIEASLETPTDTAVALFVGTMEWDNSKALAKIDKPVLLAVTESPFLEGYKKMHEQIRGSRLEVFQAGHALFVDEPEKFNQLVDGFLASLKPQGAAGR
ncbi:MAG: alpha/beta fold hydrolase [Thermoanaerobaculia bacterium]